MYFLFEFTPIRPDFGLFLWTTIFFVLFWFIIGKFAFKPIAEALRKREEDIQGSIDEAKKVKEEMAKLKAENEQILAEAREERAKILKEAKDTKNEIVTKARDEAKEEAQRISLNAKNEIEAQKRAAIVEIKSEVGTMALDIAEKVIKRELKSNPEHNSFVNQLVEEIKLN